MIEEYFFALGISEISIFMYSNTSDLVCLSLGMRLPVESPQLGVFSSFLRNSWKSFPLELLNEQVR